MYCNIIPFNQSFDDIWFTYFFEDDFELNIWQIVKAPFWNKIIYWIVSDIFAETSFDKSKIKKIISVYDTNIYLSKYQIELIKFISLNYFCLIHQSLWLFFPKNMLWKIEKDKFKLEASKDFLYDFKYNKSLTLAQKEIYETVIKDEKNKFLLYGVTWSWKTEVYINLIKHYLDIWKQSLLLVPEIILTNQIFDRIKEVFWNDVIVINSTVSDAKKTLYRSKIYNSTAKIIVWTRSSIFYPYNNLWIIIVDEEHDNSYLSDKSPRYDSIEIVTKISEETWAKLLLWSWTPKINHLYEAINWKYKILNLFSEYE